MKRILLYTWMSIYGLTATFGQEYFPKNDGIKTSNDQFIVFKNATLHVTPDKTINRGYLVIQKGKIINIGPKVTIPDHSIVVDLNGKHIYPSFIDMYTTFGIKKPKRQALNIFRSGGKPQWDAQREGYYWNDHIRPETNALTHFTYDNKKAKAFIEQGFGVVQSYMPDGILRGSGILIALQNSGTKANQLISDQSAQFLSFDRSQQTKQVYPTSLMGAMALIRQFYLDADWYTSEKTTTKDLAIEAYLKNKDIPQIFEAGSRINGFRADKIANEFDMSYIIVGGGDEYQRIKKVKATQADYIIPINFPEAYDVSDPLVSSIVSLGDMLHWNQAPTNPYILQKNGVTFALTTHKLKKIADFKKQLNTAFKYGLNKKNALAALTTIPAKLLGKSDLLGTLKPNSYANFIITNGEVFGKETVIYENWVQGQKKCCKSDAS